jgi:hypothetical protein
MREWCSAVRPRACATDVVEDLGPWATTTQLLPTYSHGLLTAWKSLSYLAAETMILCGLFSSDVLYLPVFSARAWYPRRLRAGIWLSSPQYRSLTSATSGLIAL